MWEWTPTLIAAAVSCGISFCSFLLAAWSLRISLINRRLALQQESHKQPKLLVESMKNFRTDIGDHAYFIVHLQITNTSENHNAAKRVELMIHLPDGRNRSALRLEPTDEEAQGLERFKNRVRIPIQLSAGSAAAGWAIFAAPVKFLRGKDIKEYNLEVEDIHSSVKVIQSLIFLSER